MDINKNYIIYMHKNKINNKIYIGLTKQSLERRSRNGKGYLSSSYFYNAIQKYGWNNFEHIILEENLTLDEAKEKEKYYIQKYNSTDRSIGYNIKDGGEFGGLGVSEEGRKRQSEASKQNWENPNFQKMQSEKAKNQWKDINFQKMQSEKAKRQWEDPNFKEKQYNQKQSKKVQCIETGDIFPSQERAAKWCGLSCGKSIKNNILGVTSYAGKINNQKLHWRYIEDGNTN